MCNQTTSQDMTNATFLPESEAGRMPCVSQACQMMLPFGQVAVPASPSASLAISAGQQMNDTSGLSGTASLTSAALQSSLASKLQAALPLPGSMLYSMTWKAQVTPAQRQICALRASGRRISDNACTGWPTPSATDYKGGYFGGRKRNGKWSTDRLDVTAQLAIRGKNQNGLIAETESAAQLNPELSRWLMGFPQERGNFAPTETPSSRRSRRNL